MFDQYKGEEKLEGGRSRWRRGQHVEWRGSEEIQGDDEDPICLLSEERVCRSA